MSETPRISASEDVKDTGIMSRINGMAKNMRLVTAMVLLMGASACGKDTGSKAKKGPDSCGSANTSECVNGNEKPFDPSGFMAFTKIDEKSEGRLEVKDLTGEDARYNGYYLDYTEGTVDAGEYWLIMTPAVGTGLPNPGSGKLITASGVELLLIPVGNEYKDNGDFNEIAPLKQVDTKFRGFRGTVVNFDQTDDTLKANIPFSMVADGTVGHLKHFSTKYLVDRPAQMNVKVTQGAVQGEFYMDFEGTTDEGTSDGLGFAVDVPAGGTVEKVSETLYKVMLPYGGNTVTAKVKDQFGKEIATKDFTIDVTKPVLLDNVNVVCAPNAITTGETSECDAVAQWTDSTQKRVDADCAWSAVTGTVDNAGTFSPAPVSETDEVSCTYGGMTGRTRVEVAGVVTGVTVVCNPNTVQVGQNSKCDAVAKWSDGVTTAEDSNCAWNAVTGTVDAAGLYSAPASIAVSPITDPVQCDLDGIVGTANVAVNSLQTECESAGGTWVDSSCWVESAVGGNCTDACSTNLNPAFQCNPTGWDDINFNVCSAFYPSITNKASLPSSDSNFETAPYSVSGIICRNRTDITTLSDQCGASTSGYIRFCKCD